MKLPDARLTCPNCSSLIRLRSIKPDAKILEATAVPMVATCQSCGRAFTAEEWRDYYGPGGLSGEGEAIAS